MTTNNACGSCTLCCDLLAVTFPTYKKPPRTPCTHCVKGGCGIYADRPDPCQGFQCGWLASQTLGPDAMPSAARPDRSGVVIQVTDVDKATLHCRTPDAWRAQVMHKIVKRLIGNRATVMIEHPDGMKMIERDLSVTDMLETRGAGNNLSWYTRKERAA